MTTVDSGSAACQERCQHSVSHVNSIDILKSGSEVKRLLYGGRILNENICLGFKNLQE